jgi:hypothetical protein
MNEKIPLVIEFVPGSKIRHEKTEELSADLDHAPLPGTFIQLPNGNQVAIPSDQVVLDEDAGGSARVGLGGMSFEGMENDKLIFWRVRDIMPEELVAPGSVDALTLEPQAVASITVQGTRVWPRTAS